MTPANRAAVAAQIDATLQAIHHQAAIVLTLAAIQNAKTKAKQP